MKPDRLAALTTATDDLTWLNQIPHTIDQIIGLHAEATRTSTRPMRHGMTNDEILASISGRGGPTGTGGHSDPTAMAALWGQPDATDPDETVATIDAAIDLVATSAVELGALCADTLGLPRWTPAFGQRRQPKVAATISALHHARPRLTDTAAALAGDDLTQLDTLVHTHVAETADWLRTKAGAIWTASKGEQAIVAVQKTRVSCTSCARFDLDVDVEHYRDRCRSCGDFQRVHGCRPTERICRLWNDLGPRARVTPTMVLEAKAAASTTKGRKRSA